MDAIDDGWIEWRGGECPVHPRDIVEYKLRGGGFTAAWEASYLSWEHEADVNCKAARGDIIAYRVVQP